MTETSVAERQGSTRTRPGQVLVIMCAGMFLVLLDVTIVNVALPDIAKNLHSGVAALQSVVDGYAVAIASLLLAAGTIGDRLGHRRVVLVGLTIFGIASLGCALAPDVVVLVGARAVQGVGAALLLPGSMAVIAQVYPDRAAQARALGTWAAIASLALPVGPLLGGILVGTFGWRAVFWINVPLVLLTVVATRMVVPDLPATQRGRPLLSGLAAAVVGLAALVSAVIELGRGASSIVVVALAVLCLLAFALLLSVESRSANPNLPLDLLRRAQFLAPNVVALTMNLVFNGTLFVATLYLQTVRGHSAIMAGVLVLPMAVPLVLLGPVSGRLTAVRGPRSAIALGAALAVAGSVIVAFVPAGGTAVLESGMFVMGCGAGLVTASVVAAALRATPADRAGLATGMSNTARQTGTALGVAVFGAVAGSASHHHAFIAAIGRLGLVSAVLWLGALLLALRYVETSKRPTRQAPSDATGVS